MSNSKKIQHLKNKIVALQKAFDEVVEEVVSLEAADSRPRRVTREDREMDEIRKGLITRSFKKPASTKRA